jgi:hypothetical protein
MDVPAAIDEVIRELEKLLGKCWFSAQVTPVMRAAKKAKALAANDYKTLWEMEREDAAAATKRAEELNALYQEERAESMRLYRRLLQYEGEEPRAESAKAGAEPSPADIWLRLAARNPSLACEAPGATVTDNLYD